MGDVYFMVKDQPGARCVTCNSGWPLHQKTATGPLAAKSQLVFNGQTGAYSSYATVGYAVYVDEDRVVLAQSSSVYNGGSGYECIAPGTTVPNHGYAIATLHDGGYDADTVADALFPPGGGITTVRLHDQAHEYGVDVAPMFSVHLISAWIGDNDYTACFDVYYIFYGVPPEIPPTHHAWHSMFVRRASR